MSTVTTRKLFRHKRTGDLYEVATKAVEGKSGSGPWKLGVLYTPVGEARWYWRDTDGFVKRFEPVTTPPQEQP